jgi:KUP system potassium uptake protein
MQAFRERLIPIDQFMASVAARKIPRVPGTAVFLTRTERDTPPVMVWHVKQNRALHEHVLVVSVVVDSVPWIADSERMTTTLMAPNVWRATAHYGFMERPDIPALLAQARDHGCAVDLDDVTYYVGHETVVHREDGKGLPAWEEKLFATMERNAVHVTGFFKLPVDQVVEIGRHVAI